jgi:hypothetical protein
LTRASRKKKSSRKSIGRRVGEGIRSAGELGRDAVNDPRRLPGRAHGWLRTWFHKVWDVRGGGLYAVGFAVSFLYFEGREIVFDDIPGFIALNNVFSSELVAFGIEVVVDTMINFVRALIWPVYAVGWQPPIGAIALGLAYVLFPRYLKPSIERWLFGEGKRRD